VFVTVLARASPNLVVLVPLAAAYAAWARGRLGWAVLFTALALSKHSSSSSSRPFHHQARLGGLWAHSRRPSRPRPGLPRRLWLRSVLNFLTRLASGRSPAGCRKTDQLVYTDPAVYSLRNIIEALPGSGKPVALVILVLLLALVALS